MSVSAYSNIEPVNGVHPTDFPAVLRNLDVWVVEDGKRPVYPSTNWGKSGGTTFDEAWSEYQRRVSNPNLSGDGLGIILRPENEHGIVVLDGDDVRRENGEIHPKFEELVLDRVDTFCEVSSSGFGTHVIMVGAEGLIDEHTLALPLDDEPFVNGKIPKVEILGGAKGSGNNVVLTGDVLRDSDVAHDTEYVRDLHSKFEYRGVDSECAETKHDARQSIPDVDEGDATYSVETVRETLRTWSEYGSGYVQELAQHTIALLDSTPARNPDNDYVTDTVDDVDYDSPSHADWKLCSNLAYFTRNDEASIKAVWKDSNRWARPVKTKSQSYRDRTVRGAVAQNEKLISEQNIMEVN